MEGTESPQQIVAWLGAKQRTKIAKKAKYGKRSQWIRDAVDAYEGPFVPRDVGKSGKLSPECMRFFKRQRVKIQRHAPKGLRSQYIRDAIDHFNPST